MIINLGTLVVTALLVRAAVLLAVPETTQRGLHLIARVTGFAVWPLQQIAPFRRTVGGGLIVADIVTFVLIVAGWLLLLGIISGWENEGRRLDTGPSDTGLRP